MKATINTGTGFYNLDKAIQIANEMNENPWDDWEYKVVDCNNGYGRIDVYDEDGELAEQGFMVR